jgi:hypothetical protein
MNRSEILNFCKQAITLRTPLPGHFERNGDVSPLETSDKASDGRSG